MPQAARGHWGAAAEGPPRPFAWRRRGESVGDMVEEATGWGKPGRFGGAQVRAFASSWRCRGGQATIRPAVGGAARLLASMETSALTVIGLTCNVVGVFFLAN